MMISLDTLQTLDREAWDARLLSAPEASIWQTASWGAFTEKFLKMETKFLTVREETGRVLAQLLVFQQVAHHRFFRKRPAGALLLELAKPWFKELHWLDGPVVFDKGRAAALIEALVDFLEDYSWRCGIVAQRGVRLPVYWEDADALAEADDIMQSRGYERKDWATFVIDLRPTIEEIWRSFKSNVRNKIRKCEKQGVTIHKDSTDERLPEYQAILEEDRRHIGERPGSIQNKLMRREHLQDNNHSDWKLYYAAYEGRMVGGMITFAFNGNAIHEGFCRSDFCRERNLAVYDGLIVGNVAHSNNSEGIDMDGSDNKRNTFLNNKSFRNNEGFRLKGESHTLIGNRAETSDDEGFQLGSGFSKSLVERNFSRGNDTKGFDIDGDENTVLRNVSLNNGQRGFEIDGDDSTLTKNLSIGNQQDGFGIIGDDNEVTGNRAIENQGDGFDINCSPDPTCGGPIIGNRSIRNTDDGFNLDDLDDTTISGNKAIGNEEEGFDILSVDETLFEKNLAKDNGEEGFEIFSSSGTNTFINNRAIGNAEDGFRIFSSSNSNTFVRNTIVRNDGDGIDVDSDVDDTVIDDNIVKNNRGTGIENDGGSDTDLKNNVVKGNRTDIAGKGDSCGNVSATDGGSNVFATGGFDVCSPGTGDE